MCKCVIKGAQIHRRRASYASHLWYGIFVRLLEEYTYDSDGNVVSVERKKYSDVDKEDYETYYSWGIPGVKTWSRPRTGSGSISTHPLTSQLTRMAV